ncbi:RHS repeat-associated core domain-containing protein, partial [Flavobacterium sp.]|uniref:RHS repeat-associated core domain-containing protein n=1 Tax=Flavobacterium sp. TaxID=239 RepID=UPI00261A456D
MYLSPLVLDYIIIKPVIRSNYQYKLNGNEWQDELGLNLYDMNARQYDPSIGRFTSIDPIVHHSQSTYAAFDNNPAFWADPSGAAAVYNWDTGKYMDG